MSNEIEDAEIWPDTRLDAAQVEIDAERKRRAGAAEAARVAADPEGARQQAERKVSEMTDAELRNLCRDGDAANEAKRKRLIDEARSAQRAQGAR